MPMTNEDFRELARVRHQLEGMARGHGGALSMSRAGERAETEAVIVYASGGRTIIFRGWGKNQLEAMLDLRTNYLHGRYAR